MSRGGYDRELVERLLPAVWDEEYAYGMRNPYMPDPDMPKGTVDKKASGTLIAHLADIRRAWRLADIPHGERQALLLRYGLDYKHDDVARVLGVHRVTAIHRSERGVGRLNAWLNGTEYDDADEAA